MSQTNLYMPLTSQCAMEHFTCISTKTVQSYTVLIQLNSETLFKDGDPVSLKLIFPGVIQTCKQIQQVFIDIYKTTQVHQTITGKHNLHFHTKHIHKDSYLTYTMYIQTCIFTTLLSFMNKKEQYIVNNKHV